MCIRDRQKHVIWAATREEARALPSPYPANDSATGSGDGDFPPMPSLDATVTFPATGADADVWLMLSTTACGFTFACTPVRTLRADAPLGATSATLRLEQLHAGPYFAIAVLDRDRNLASTLGPTSGDGISMIDREIEVAAEGATAASFAIALSLIHI